MAKLLGALIGAALDRRDGDSGIRGALIGAAIQGGMRVALPLGAAVLVGLAVKRRWQNRHDATAEARPEPAAG